MSPSSSPGSPGKGPVPWTVATILLLAAIVGSFWVPIYARTTPKIGPFAFFYWYQLLLVPAVAIVSWIAFLLIRPRPGASRSPAHAADRPDRTEGR
ncbi:MAG: hypothetical protein M0030_25175 [Actinomycetota bacterium]|nr:hypothetical protein [Actinomycetota bacterium]